VETALNRNLTHAISFALLQLPEKFTEEELFFHIANISYLGDFRMIFGENPNKVRNIAEGNKEGFRALYRPIANQEFSTTLHWNGNSLQQDITEASRNSLIAKLPSVLQINIKKHYKHPYADPRLRDFLKQGVKKIGWIPNITQSLKGICSAGPITSVQYASRKVFKMLGR